MEKKMETTIEGLGLRVYSSPKSWDLYAWDTGTVILGKNRLDGKSRAAKERTQVVYKNRPREVRDLGL